MLGKIVFNAGVLHYVKVTPRAFDALASDEEQIPHDGRDWQMGDIAVFKDEGDREAHGRVTAVSHEFITIKMEE